MDAPSGKSVFLGRSSVQRRVMCQQTNGYVLHAGLLPTVAWLLPAGGSESAVVLVLVRDNAGVDISARTEYAIRAMLALAQAATASSGPLSVDTLATRQDLPRRFLESIVSDLRRAGLVVSTRGAQGG